MSELPELHAKLLTANAEALDRAAEWTGHSRTDAVNRAIALYEGIVAARLLDDEVLEYIDEHNQPVELVLPAGREVIRATLARERAARRRLEIRLRVAYFVAWAAIMAAVVAMLLWVG